METLSQPDTNILQSNRPLSQTPEQAFLDAVERAPANALHHYQLGSFYFNQHQIEKAMDCFRQAVRLAPDMREAVLGYAVTSQLNGVGEKAAEYCQSILQKNPQDTQVHQTLETIFQERQYKIDLAKNSGSASLPAPNFRNRNTLINYLIDRFGYRKYLEIGCKEDHTFSKVKIPYKIGMDPVQGGTLRMTSDEYFALSNDTFDVILIDGLHLAEQVVRDIRNALNHLRDNGTIILHDCNPAQELHQVRNSKVGTWNGDVWKGLVYYRQDPYLDIVVGNFDQGIGIIRKRLNPNPIRLAVPYLELRWSDLVENRQQWLNLSTAEEIARWL